MSKKNILNGLTEAELKNIICNPKRNQAERMNSIKQLSIAQIIYKLSLLIRSEILMDKRIKFTYITRSEKRTNRNNIVPTNIAIHEIVRVIEDKIVESGGYLHEEIIKRACRLIKNESEDTYKLTILYILEYLFSIKSEKVKLNNSGVCMTLQRLGIEDDFIYFLNLSKSYSKTNFISKAPHWKVSEYLVLENKRLYMIKKAIKKILGKYK